MNCTRRAESTGDTAAAFTVGDAPDLRLLYVDRYSGRVLVVMDASRRGYAWIYYRAAYSAIPRIDQSSGHQDRHGARLPCSWIRIQHHRRHLEHTCA